MSRREDQNVVYGVNAVLEALRAGKRQVEAIVILQSARPDRLKSVLELAREKTCRCNAFRDSISIEA